MFYCLSHAGLPNGCVPESTQELLSSQVWCVLGTMGQLDGRLIKPYTRQPWSFAGLINESKSDDERKALFRELKSENTCCCDRFFGIPVLDALETESAIFHPHNLHQKLVLAFRTKVSNMELECNFSRAARMRQSHKGNSHNIPSMVAKHLTAEARLAQARLQSNRHVLDESVCHREEAGPE